jgi:hypothetical protein
LLWHQLKMHQSSLGAMTHAALISWISDDSGIVSSKLASVELLQANLIARSDTVQPGFRFCVEWGNNMLAETGIIFGRELCNPLALGTALRLIRHLDAEQQDRWLSDIHALAKASRKSMSLLASSPDWQPCLFHLISDTLEILNPMLLKEVDAREPPDSVVVSSSTLNGGRQSPRALVQKRLDSSLEIYSTLLGHVVREGGDKVRLRTLFGGYCSAALIFAILQALAAVEVATSLQRACANGHDVIFLVLSGLCADLFDHGTLLEVGLISAQDWKDVDIEQESLLLKHSARLVTDAILSNGTKGLNMPAAVRSWRSLRHLTEIVAAIVTTRG